MKAKLIAFGEVELGGKRYDYDLVIDAGEVHKRHKKASKSFKDQYGHTPLSAEEYIPWGGQRLIVGTGVYGKLPITPEVETEARRRGVELVAVPTEEACQLLARHKSEDTFAILHITC